jgi:hypothetical protein
LAARHAVRNRRRGSGDDCNSSYTTHQSRQLVSPSLLYWLAVGLRGGLGSVERRQQSLDWNSFERDELRA